MYLHSRQKRTAPAWPVLPSAVYPRRPGSLFPGRPHARL